MSLTFCLIFIMCSLVLAMWKGTARRDLLPDTDSSAMNFPASKLKEINLYSPYNLPSFKNSATVTQNRLNTFANFVFFFYK